MLGIFQHKKEEYNRLILKSLAFGSKTTKQIGEYIYLNREERPKPKDNMENEVRTIVSIISRKGYRLEELKSKQYILQEKGFYNLTAKGMCVALTLFNTVSDIFPYFKSDSTMQVLKERIYEVPQIKSFVQAYLPEKTIASWFEFAKSPEYLQFLKDYANELISQGVDLDRMSENEFQTALYGKLLSRMINLEGLLKNFQRTQNEGVKP
jgi:hypothetical protein